MEVTYTRGKPGELDEIRDFANMVFSMHTRPHDFARMLPKLYADGSATEGEHYLVREDGRLVAAVCAHPFTLACRDRTLPCAAIGSVSVHPYVRGKGYMRKLMTTAVADMAQNGIALSVLDGRRHRYAYFGYEPAGLRAEYTITPDNLRHMASAHKLALAAAPAIPSDAAETKACRAAARYTAFIPHRVSTRLLSAGTGVCLYCAAAVRLQVSASPPMQAVSGSWLCRTKPSCMTPCGLYRNILAVRR